MVNDWLASWEALYSVFADSAYSNIAINEAVSRHRGCDSGFVRVMTKGVIRDSLRLDAIVDKLAKKGIKGIKPRTLIVLKMGIFAIDSINSVPEHAAVNEAVRLAKKVSRGSDGFVNGMLRNYLRVRDSLELPDNFEIKYGFPSAVAELLCSQYGDEAEEIMQGLNSVPKLFIRVNRVKTDRSALIERLKNAGFYAEAVEGTDGAIEVRGSGITENIAFKEGEYSIQSLPSIMSIEAFKPMPGDSVLDMCAAPGGKSCAMAEIMGNRGEIISCDVYEHRLGLIEASAERLGIDIITTSQTDGTVLCPKYAGNFDCVLADVPCSGLGVTAGKPELKLRTDVNSYNKLIDIQKKILHNAYEYAKIGGKIMYSTCTINRYENEYVVEDFMKSHKCAQIVEKRLILPYNNSVGFYFVIIKKADK